MNQVTPHYHPDTTIPGTNVPLDDNSISAVPSDVLGIPKYGTLIILLSLLKYFITSKSLYGPPITLSYDCGSSSYSGQPSTLYTNQSGSSSPNTQPQRQISTLSMMTNSTVVSKGGQYDYSRGS